MTTLRLLIPGLLGPWPAAYRADPAFPRPGAPALEWLLTRASVSAAPAPLEAELFWLFGLPAADDADLPIAAITRLADGAIADDGWWWRADPVCFRPDLNGVFLTEARKLAIAPAEAQALVAAFNRNFAADGLQLDALRPDRWYLRLPADPGVRTHPLALAASRDLGALLPYGPAAKHWHTLMTEAQMLFHTHPVNQAREERNQPLINGLWLWGGGTCPTGARLPAADLYAHDPLARGLAQLTGLAVSPVPDNVADWLDAATPQDGLILLETTRFDSQDDTLEAWSEHVIALERDWFAPCRRLLRAGQLTTLHLHPGAGRAYAITRQACWRFWRYPKPLPAYLS